MLIQCFFPRRTGTPITLGDGAKIPFQPNELGDHVAEVKDKKHIAQLLSQHGVYRQYDFEASKGAKELAAAKAKESAKDSTEDIGNTHETGQEAQATTKQYLADEPSVVGPSLETLNAMELPAVQEEFKKLFGRDPNPKTSKEKLIKVIMEREGVH